MDIVVYNNWTPSGLWTWKQAVQLAARLWEDEDILKQVREGGDREFKEIPDSRRADEKRCDSHRGELSKILVEGGQNSCDHVLTPCCWTLSEYLELSFQSNIFLFFNPKTLIKHHTIYVSNSKWKGDPTKPNSCGTRKPNLWRRHLLGACVWLKKKATKIFT